MMLYEDEDEILCACCATCLIVPYIMCHECAPPQVCICLHCFAKGSEFRSHHSDHNYQVVKNDFSMFETAWTAEEELQILKAVSDCGIGNWSDVANQVRTKTAKQCEKHYNKCYLEAPKPPLPEIMEADITYHPCPVTYRCCEDPPRPPDGSTLQQEMSGYMAPRGDFAFEYDNFAETAIRDIHFDSEQETNFDKELKLAVVDCYNNKLRERQRRKRIVRNYGLINTRKNNLLNHRYEKLIGPKYETLKSLCRLLPPVKFDIYIESLCLEHELRREVKCLQNHREHGIMKLNSGKIFEHLSRRREEEKGRRSLLADVLNHIQDETACARWLEKQAAMENISKGIPVSLPSAPRRSAPPLDISNLPGYDKLNEREKELCSYVRLVPESYLEFRQVLSAECQKQGFIKLAQARTMIKIDVNKTRKIFDFLITEGVINKDSGS